MLLPVLALGVFLGEVDKIRRKDQAQEADIKCGDQLLQQTSIHTSAFSAAAALTSQLTRDSLTLMTSIVSLSEQNTTTTQQQLPSVDYSGGGGVGGNKCVIENKPRS